MGRNYYLILGVLSNATHHQINAAYRQRAMESHPDRSGTDSAPFLEVQEAYEVLGDPARREAYDDGIRMTHVRSAASRNTVEPFSTYGFSPRRPFAEPFKAGNHDFAEIRFRRDFQSLDRSFQELFEEIWKVFGRF